MIATAAAVAFVVISCKSKLSEAAPLNLAEVPYQTVTGMNVIQSENGRLQMRIVAARMERYSGDSLDWELFPGGLEVYSYNEEGLLETTLRSDNARHDTRKGRGREKEEVWMAFGNVRIRNILKQENIETDTLYWDRSTGQIYNECYVRLYSPDGFIQGYGLQSDDKARNSIILRPFNNFFVIEQDTTRVAVDSANLIGPVMRKLK